MRTRRQLLEKFTLSHLHPVNILVHNICVPIIVFSTLALAWLVPVGRWLGAPEELAPWINAATLAALPIGLFYLRLSLGSLLTMAAWFAASVLLILAIQSLGAPLLLIAAALWVAAWVAQVYGHRVEGARPSATDDIVFFLIGPLFVTDRALRRLGLAR